MKQHWVFVHGRESSPVVRSRAGIKICYRDHAADGPDLEMRVPAVLAFYDTRRRKFRIVRLNDRTGIEVEGAEYFQSSYGGDRTGGSHRFEERPLREPEDSRATTKQDVIDLDQRQYQRVPTKCPLKYRIGGFDLGGVTVNASRAGIMLKSSLPSKTAFEMLRVLDNDSNSHAELEVGLDSETHLIDARVKHFHLDSSDERGYLLRVGFEFLNDEDGRPN